MKTQSYSNLVESNNNAPLVQVAKLKDGSAIVRLETPRRAKWFRVLPYDCDTDDSRCVQILWAELRKGYRSQTIRNAEEMLLASPLWSQLVQTPDNYQPTNQPTN